MEYFVTGATGFIGKRLVRKLLARPGSTVYFLTRSNDPEKLAALLRELTREKLAAMAEKARALAKPEATRAVAEVCMEVAR